MQAARRSGQRAVRDALSAPTPVEDRFESRQPPAPWGHPDLVLGDAVTAGAISCAEADMIGATRLEHISARDYAVTHGLGYGTFLRTRLRAEGRLVAWLTQDAADTSGPDTARDGDRHARFGDANACVPDGADEGIVERVVAATGRSPAWVRAALSTTSATGRTSTRRASRHAARRPADGRPPTRRHARPSSRTVSESERG
jgi:hypothetical protein